MTRNFSGYTGGGAGFSTLINCTVVSNISAAYGSSVTGGGTIRNCILYYNLNYFTNEEVVNDSSRTNCCFPSTGALGPGSLTNAPLFADLATGDFHLSPISPCINAGTNAANTNSTDLDGNPRVVDGRVDIGAYEFQSPLRFVNLSNSTPISPYLTWKNAATNIQDAIDVANAGDVVVVSNGTYQAGGRAVYGTETNRVVVDKPVTVQSVNGASATIIQGAGINFAIRCVYLTNGATLSGFTLTNGGTRFRVGDITQDSGAGVWCESSNAIITNCVLSGNSAYQYGGGAYQGTLVNCILANNRLVGGFTGTPLGAGAYSCILSNCLVVSNRSIGGAGGVYASTLINCVVSSNTASGNGGGAYLGTLSNCIVIRNSAQNGGGVYDGNLLNCTVVSNSASVSGGGVYSQETVQNCIMYYNSAPMGANDHLSKFDYCCTTPVYSYTPHSFTNAPLIMDPASGDFRLQTNSPCINSGNNSYATNATDIDGNPRVAGGTVDIGAYELPSPASTLSYSWAQQFGLPTDGSADFNDADGDHLNNWQEWRTGTDPTNALSVLQLLSVTGGDSGIAVTWQSVSGSTYFLQRSSDLATSPFQLVVSNLFGTAGTKTYLDTNAVGPGPFFYRVGVQ